MRIAWTRVRKAQIPDEERKILERYGENVIAQMVTSGYGPPSEVLKPIYYDKGKLARAEEWLTERSDKNERREQRLETLEWAILVLVLLEVIADRHALGDFARELLAVFRHVTAL